MLFKKIVTLNDVLNHVKEYNFYELVNYLIKIYEVDRKYAHGKTLVMSVIQGEDEIIFQNVLSHNHDINIKDDYSRAALDYLDGDIKKIE